MSMTLEQLKQALCDEAALRRYESSQGQATAQSTLLTAAKIQHAAAQAAQQGIQPHQLAGLGSWLSPNMNSNDFASEANKILTKWGIEPVSYGGNFLARTLDRLTQMSKRMEELHEEVVNKITLEEV